MSDFVYDNTALPESKTDKNAVASGQDPTKFWKAADANLYRSIVDSLRNGIVAALWRKLVHNASAPVGGSTEVVERSNSGVAEVSQAGDSFEPVITRINVKRKGATGGDTVDDRAAFVAAIAQAATYPHGAEVYVPPGTYKISSGSLTMPQNVTLRGAGEGKSIIRFANNSSTDGLVWSGASKFYTGGGLYDITIKANAATDCRDLVSLTNWTKFRSRHVSVLSAGRYGLSITDCIDCDFTGFDARVCTSAGVWTGTASADVTTTIGFHSCYFHDTTNGPGANIEGNAITFDSKCIFESNGGSDHSTGEGIVIRAGQVTLDNPYFENNSQRAIDAGTTGAVTLNVTNPIVVGGGYVQAGKYGFRYRNVTGGATLGGHMISGYTNSIDMDAACQMHNILGIYTGATDPTYDAGGGHTLADYKGLVHYQKTADLSGQFKLTGNFDLEVAPGCFVNFAPGDASAKFYRSAANTIRTPGSMTVDGVLTGTGAATMAVDAKFTPAVGLQLRNGMGIFIDSVFDGYDIAVTRASAGKGRLSAAGGASMDWTSQEIDLFLSYYGVTALKLELGKVTLGAGMKLVLDSTDSSATPGSVTINKPTGKVAIASGASTLTVTNSLVTTSSLVRCWIQQSAEDTTLTRVWANVTGAGTFDIKGNANATAAVKIGFEVIN